MDEAAAHAAERLTNFFKTYEKGNSPGV